MCTTRRTRASDPRCCTCACFHTPSLATDGLGGGGGGPERAGSGDSLGGGLPKLQPVHRLAKPDLRIVQRIGEGAFGEVSVAKAPLYGTVAVKWLKVCGWVWLMRAGCLSAHASTHDTHDTLCSVAFLHCTERALQQALCVIWAGGRAARRPQPPKRAALLWRGHTVGE